MKVPSRQQLEKHSATNTNPDPAAVNTTGSPALDRLLAIASYKVLTEPENKMDDIYDYPPSSSPSPPERRDLQVTAAAEEDEDIYDKILPIAGQRKESLRTGVDSKDPPSMPLCANVVTEDPDDQEGGNIYDIPINPITLKEIRSISTGDDELPTVYDELIRMPGDPLSHPHPPLTSNSLGRDWLRGDASEHSYSPKTHPKSSTSPGKFSHGSPFPPVNYGDSGPISERDQQKEGKQSPLSARKAAGLLPRLNPPRNRAEYEEVPLRLESAKHTESSDKSKSPEVINVYGKVTGKGRVKSETSLTTKKPTSSSSSVVLEQVPEKKQSLEVDTVVTVDTVREVAKQLAPPPSPTLNHHADGRKQHCPSPSKANQHREDHKNAEITTPSKPNVDCSPVPSPKPKPKTNRRSFFPDESTETTKAVPIPVRRTRAPTTTSPAPVPRPRRHMTDTSPPSTKHKANTLDRTSSSSSEAYTENLASRARTLGREVGASPKLSKKPVPATAPKPAGSQSPDINRHFNRNPDLPPRNPHPTTPPRPHPSIPTVGPKPKGMLSSPPANRRKLHPLPPAASPKSGSARTTNLPSPKRKRSSTSVSAVNSSPPLPPKPFLSKKPSLP